MADPLLEAAGIPVKEIREEGDTFTSRLLTVAPETVVLGGGSVLMDLFNKAPIRSVKSKLVDDTVAEVEDAYILPNDQSSEIVGAAVVKDLGGDVSAKKLKESQYGDLPSTGAIMNTTVNKKLNEKLIKMLNDELLLLQKNGDPLLTDETISVINEVARGRSSFKEDFLLNKYPALNDANIRAIKQANVLKEISKSLKDKDSTTKTFAEYFKDFKIPVVSSIYDVGKSGVIGVGNLVASPKLTRNLEPALDAANKVFPDLNKSTRLSTKLTRPLKTVSNVKLGVDATREGDEVLGGRAVDDSLKDARNRLIFEERRLEKSKGSLVPVVRSNILSLQQQIKELENEKRRLSNL